MFVLYSPFSPTRLACGLLTVTKGYRLGLAERAVPRHAGTGSPKDLGTKIWYQDLGTKILVPGSLPKSWYQDPGTKILVLAIFREKVKPITTSRDKVFEWPG